MSYKFENIPRIIWGCGHAGYGDADAKEKAMELIRKADSVFVFDSDIRDYEKHYNVQLFKPECEASAPYVWEYGSFAHAVPSEVAARMLEDFKIDFFSDFMLRDINLAEKRWKNLSMHNITDEHLVLDFNGKVYGISQCTDHCYD